MRCQAGPGNCLLTHLAELWGGVVGQTRGDMGQVGVSGQTCIHLVVVSGHQIGELELVFGRF